MKLRKIIPEETYDVSFDAWFMVLDNKNPIALVKERNIADYLVAMFPSSRTCIQVEGIPCDCYE